MNIPKKEQFSGCLIGQCLGDALGFPVEGYPHPVCQPYIEDIVRYGGWKKFAQRTQPFGQYTDDSQLARELLISYSTCNGFDPENYAGRIADIFSQGRIVGGGRATWEAALRLSQGIPWDEAGTPAPSAGNGSAMRAGPVGLIFFDDLNALIQAACDQARITHKDPRCRAGAVAIAGTVSLALQHKPVIPSDFLSRISKMVSPIDTVLSRALISLIGWIDLDPADTITEIVQAGYAPGYTKDWQGVSPFVTGSVLWSIYAFLHSPEDYMETIYTAIEVGGDVDTTAAMAGAISGAYLGIGEIPGELAVLVNDKGSWGYSELTNLANTCYEIKTRQMNR
ncbi:MAG TPA: ADP-ribosylglycohydrolase family protein [Deltaproteobacteria bacterium]|nr:ADP-ribosylglycohydrolase family protein [Deltaproteobacteria bacterium]